MRKSILLIVVLIVPPATLATVSALTRYPKRFAVVSPGELYRGGYPTAGQIRRLAGEFHIKTVVNLNKFESRPHKLEMLAALDELDLELVRIPMPGDGIADFEWLDKAADALNKPQNRPIFFHCTAGKQRSNAILAAYRLKCCDWSLEEALEELEKSHGLDRAAEKALCDHLADYATYCEDRSSDSDS